MRTPPVLPLVLAPALALGACAAVGPNYAAPDAKAPAAYGDLAADAPTGAADPAALATWWTQFNDPELAHLVQLARAGNLDLQAAASRIRQARQQAVIAGAARLPSVTATSAGVRLDRRGGPDQGGGGASGGSGQGGSGGGGGFSLPSSVELYSAGFDATWELDVFGGVRRAVEAARANTEAAEWSRRDAEVSLTAEVAADYLSYRALQQESAVLEASVRSQEDTLKIVRDRARAGLTTDLDVHQQEVQLAAARAALPQLQAQARAQVHALGVLTGQAPESLDPELAATAPAPPAPPALPVGLPSELLRRRPDVRAAERQLASATAEVGVAVAALYPKFNLIGAVSLTSSRLQDLVENPAVSTIGAGLIQWPLFQAGRLRANVGVNEERRTQAYLAYQKAVLQAVKDVEDALARYAAEQRRNGVLRQSETAAKASLKIAQDQYGHGVANYLGVLTSQQALLHTQQQLAESDGQLNQDLASLYKALGGGWAPEPAG